MNFRSRRIIDGARHQTESGDARDARHRLSTKSHGAYIRQVRSRPDFARRMPFQAQQCVLAVHARAVVFDPNQLGATPRKFHAYSPRTGIDAVLNEFLHHRSRALHDLARRDLAGNFVCEQADLSHVV